MLIESQRLAATTPPTPARVEDLIDAARAFASATRSEATLRAYRSDWADFEQWCQRHGADPLPAAPATVALYVTDLASTRKPSTITRRMAAISVAHQHVGHPSPTSDVRVREVLRGIRRTLGTAPDAATPATIGDIRTMLAHLPDDLSGLRDCALLLVGFAGALRRSELVGLNVEDLDAREEGIAVTLRRSKTDQEGEGRRIALPYGHDHHTCPVAALKAWLAAAGIESGPVFRSVNRHGQVGQGRLSTAAVAQTIKRAAARAKIDPSHFSGHSLRAGFATTAAAAGASERAIAAQTGHQSMAVLRRYVRHGSLFTDNAVNQVGL